MARVRAANIEFGNRMKDLRLDKPLKVVAHELGISSQSLLYYEKGEREPNFKMLNKIAQYYTVTVDYLTCNSDYKTPQHKDTMDLTGLDQATVDKILNINPFYLPLLVDLLNLDNFYSLMIELSKYKKVISKPGDLIIEVSPDTTIKGKEFFATIAKAEFEKLLTELTEKVQAKQRADDAIPTKVIAHLQAKEGDS